MIPDNERKLAERRSKPRLLLRLKFSYKILDNKEGPSEKYEALTKNISTSGLLFERDQQISIDRQLSMVIKLPDSHSPLLELEGKVVRIEKLLPSEKYALGIKFTKISEKDKEEIKNCLERLDMNNLLAKVRKKEISDLHLTVNSPPMIRTFGELKPLGKDPLSEEEIRQMIYSILSTTQKKYLEKIKDLDFSFSPTVDSRYRVSIYQQRGAIEVVFRNIMSEIKSSEDLGIPDIIDELCSLKDGLVIIAGTTGSGKTTTIAKMIDVINRKKGGVILSLEKPIEYLHKNIMAIVKQREVGTDVTSFAQGLKAALRQDPDVIIVGEVLDADTIETAIQAAETGHLVITSLHATDTVQVLDRLVSFFPMEQKHFLFSRLSHCIKAIVVQRLLPDAKSRGRALATEVCIANMAVRRIINSGDFTQLPSVIQTGSKYNMHLMQNSIDELFERSVIDAETHEEYSQKSGEKIHKEE